MQPDRPDRPKRSTGAKVWAGFVIVLLAAAGVFPLVSSLVIVPMADIESLEQAIMLVFPLVVYLIPFLLLIAAAVWASKRTQATRIVTVASLIVVVAACFGYWVVATDESSTSALIFIIILPVQWATAFLAHSRIGDQLDASMTNQQRTLFSWRTGPA